MRTTEMVLCAHYLKTSKFIPVCISIYILSLFKPKKNSIFLDLTFNPVIVKLPSLTSKLKILSSTLPN